MNGPGAPCIHVWMPLKSTEENVRVECRTCGQRRGFTIKEWRAMPMSRIAPTDRTVASRGEG